MMRPATADAPKDKGLSSCVQLDGVIKIRNYLQFVGNEFAKHTNDHQLLQKSALGS
jgi:hypothetical protein